jgi:hypothetical protein
MEEMRMLDNSVSLECDPEKEPQRGHSVVENGCTCALRNKMQLKAPHRAQLMHESRKITRHDQNL